jgi:hypothetical protein
VGEIVTATTGGAVVAVTATVALPEADVLAALVAVTVCCPAVAGAVYKPVVLTVPTVAPPPVTPSTDQVTAVFVVPVTAAWNCCVAPVTIEAVVGETVTVTTGGGGAVAVTVTVALPESDVFAALVAVTVCCPAVLGAVYSPTVETVPVVALPPATPSTDHVTAVFVLPVTVAWNCCVAAV